MKRTLEKLAQDRKDKEGELSAKIKEIRKQADEFKSPQNKQKLQQIISRLEEILKSVEDTPSKKRKSSFARSSKTPPEDFSQRGFNQQVFLFFKELENIINLYSQQTQELSSALVELAQMTVALTDVKDKEWDALSNNHVAMIFKSLEWRVDQL